MAEILDRAALDTDEPVTADTGLQRRLGLYDSTALAMGGMIGSGIFLVTSFMARTVGSSGWLLVAWVATGVLTLAAALSYAELAAMMPRAGGPYVFLREAFSPLWGFLFGWTFFLVSMTGSIAALAVAFARFAGVLLPGIAEDNYLVAPIHLSSRYALSLSTGQFVALLMIAVITWVNTRGIDWGKRLQNVFTTMNALALLGLIAACLLLGWNGAVVGANFGDPWQTRAATPLAPGLTTATVFGLFAAVAIAQTGSFFSTTGWESVTYAAGEVANPRRNVPLALALGISAVLALYLLANVAYLVTLPLEEIQGAPFDRVASVALERVLPGTGATLMAAVIVVATFGCNNAQILSGARVTFAMARDGLFFDSIARLNRARVPGRALVLQGLWAGGLILARTFNPATKTYGDVYADLLDYVVSALVLFYVLTILCLFRLRATRPDAERPYRVPGYPFVPAFFVVGAASILLPLFAFRPYTTWPGLGIVLLGVPIYLWRRRATHVDVRSPTR